VVHPRGIPIVSSTLSYHGIMDSEVQIKRDQASRAHDLCTPCASEIAEDTSHEDKEVCSEDQENTLLNSQCEGGDDNSAAPCGESPPRSPDHQSRTQGHNVRSTIASLAQPDQTTEKS
jgi:hypothetical protein